MLLDTEFAHVPYQHGGLIVPAIEGESAFVWRTFFNNFGRMAQLTYCRGSPTVGTKEHTWITRRDIGHFVAANSISPVPFLQKYHDRITHLHLKNRKKNMGANLSWGQGNTPIVECLQLIRDKKWNIPGIIEMEHPTPAGSDNWIELGKCIEFCKKALL